MSMIGNYLMLPPEMVARIQAGESLADLVYDEDNSFEEEMLDVDKSWHAIHYALTGKLWDGDGSPLANAVLGGDPINEEDMGYGPAMLLTAEQVKASAQALAQVGREEFRKGFDFPAMVESGVYPILDSENGDAFFDYVWGYFPEVQRFFKKAASEGKCVLFYIN